MGEVINDEAMVWLFSAPPIERIPVSFFKEAKKWLAEAMKSRRKIWSSVAEFHKQSIRFYTMLGFRLTEPVLTGPNGMVFRDLVMERE